MSLTIVRMNTASSQTSTVLLTLPPLSDYLLNHRPDIENEDSLSINLDRSSYRTSQCHPRLPHSGEQVYRHILNVAYVVDANSHPPFLIVGEQDQALSTLEGGLPQRCSAIDHRHNRSTAVGESTARFRC